MTDKENKFNDIWKKFNIIQMVVEEAAKDVRPAPPLWHCDFLETLGSRLKDIENEVKQALTLAAETWDAREELRGLVDAGEKAPEGKYTVEFVCKSANCRPLFKRLLEGVE